jgi:dCTP deaminase
MAQTYGAIPYQMMREMMEANYIQGAQTENLQPGSLDLTVTDEAYRMKGSYLPRTGETIEALIKHGSLFRHSLEHPLEKDGVYLIRLQERLNLPPGIHASVSNKSSSGRINLRGRLLADGVSKFDEIPPGYQGSLWIEVITKSFPVLLHPGDRLNQIRFFHGEAKLSSLEHRMLFDRYGLLRDQDGKRLEPTPSNIGRGVTMTIDLSNFTIVGWKAKETPSHILDTAKFDHEATDFFDPVYRPKNGELILHPNAFFILATKERIVTPPGHASEMAAYDATKGEFRSHFAGFIDPGNGWMPQVGDPQGFVPVLEVEAYGQDFILRDGQPICLIVFERILQIPERLYGTDLKSNYVHQYGPKLAKWFRPVDMKPALAST